GRGENTADDIAGVIAAHAADDRIQVACLPFQIGVGKICQVEPDRDRQASQQQRDQQEKNQSSLAAKDLPHGGSPVRLIALTLPQGTLKVCFSSRYCYIQSFHLNQMSGKRAVITTTASA